MPSQHPRELTIHILPHRYARLHALIFGAPTSLDPHLAGIRAVALALESDAPGLKIYVPVIAQFDKNSHPIVVTDAGVTRAEWKLLKRFVREEGGVLRVVLGYDGGDAAKSGAQAMEVAVKITRVGGKVDDGRERAAVRFLWRDGEANEEGEWWT